MSSASEHEEFGAYPKLLWLYATLQSLLSLFVAFIFIFFPSASVDVQDGQDSKLIPQILLFPFYSYSNFERQSSFTYFESIEMSSPFSAAYSASFLKSTSRFDTTVQASIVWIYALFLICTYAMEGFLHWYRFYSLFGAHKYLRDFSLCKIVRGYLCGHLLVQMLLLAFTVWCGFYLLLLVLLIHALFIIFVSNRHVHLLLQSSCTSLTEEQIKILMRPLFVTRIYAIASVVPSFLFLLLLIVTNSFPDCMLYYPIFACLNTLLLARMFVRNRKNPCCCGNSCHSSPDDSMVRDTSSSSTGNDNKSSSSVCCGFCDKKSDAHAEEVHMELSTASPPTASPTPQPMQIKIDTQQAVAGDVRINDEIHFVDVDPEEHSQLNVKMDLLAVAGSKLSPKHAAGYGHGVHDSEQTFVVRPAAGSVEPSAAYATAGELEPSLSSAVPSPKSHSPDLQPLAVANNNPEMVVIPFTLQVSAPSPERPRNMSEASQHSQTSQTAPYDQVLTLSRMHTDDDSKMRPFSLDAEHRQISAVDDQEMVDYANLSSPNKFTPNTHDKQTARHHLTLEAHTHSAQPSGSQMPRLQLHSQFGTASSSSHPRQHIKHVSMQLRLSMDETLQQEMEPGSPTTPCPEPPLRLDTLALEESLTWLHMLRLQGLIQNPADMLRSHQILQNREKRRSQKQKSKQPICPQS